MAKPRIIINETNRGYQLAWYFPDEQDIGAYLGEHRRDGKGRPPKNPGDWEHWAACRAVRAANLNEDYDPFIFASKAEAQKALKIAKAAIKEPRPTAVTVGSLSPWTPFAFGDGRQGITLESREDGVLIARQNRPGKAARGEPPTAVIPGDVMVEPLKITK